MADTGLGRATIREALRVLESESLITPRLGRYGGWTVRRPGRDSITRSIDVFIRGTQIHFESLLATREAIEPSCAALAAEHRTDADLEAIERRSARLAECWEDLAEYLLENVRWHLAIVDATHNELLIASRRRSGRRSWPAPTSRTSTRWTCAGPRCGPTTAS